MTTVTRPSWSRSLRWIRTPPIVSGNGHPVLCRQHGPRPQPPPRHARHYAGKPPIDASDAPKPTEPRTFANPWPSRRKEPTDGLIGPESTSQSSTAALRATESSLTRHSTPFPPKITRYELDPSPQWRGPTSLTNDSDGTKRDAPLVYLTIDDIPTPFDPIFLRDACPCPLCVDPSTSQKRFQTTDIPADCAPTDIWPNPTDNSVTLRWSNDPIPGHTVSTFPINLLRRFNYSPNSMSDFSSNHQPPTTHAYWTGLGATARNPPCDYASLVSSPRELQLGLDRLQHRGMIFITGVPPAPSSISHIATRFGPLRNTFYGPTWDVRSVPSAKNVAYTSQSLALHMDLLYYSSPPSYQFLHCLANTASGGATLFSDGFGAAATLRDLHPRLFDALASFPVAFHYRNDNQRYLHSHPTIELHASGEIRAVNYSPPFQAPFAVHTAAGETGAAFPAFLEALRVFADILERSVYERRLEAGECIVFDNRRVVHGRRAFDADGGDRWLRGAYVDVDAVRSAERLLHERAREERWYAAEREGNAARA